MKVLLKKSCRVNVLSGVVEVNEREADRLFLLDLAEPYREKQEKKTSKKEQ